MTSLIRGSLLAFLFAFVLSAELVEVRPVDRSKLSAVKDAESILEKAQKALNDAESRLEEAKAAAKGTPPVEETCAMGELGKRIVTHYELVDRFILVHKSESQCGPYIVLTGSSSDSKVRRFWRTTSPPAEVK